MPTLDDGVFLPGEGLGFDPHQVAGVDEALDACEPNQAGSYIETGDDAHSEPKLQDLQRGVQAF